MRSCIWDNVHCYKIQIVLLLPNAKLEEDKLLLFLFYGFRFGNSTQATCATHKIWTLHPIIWCECAIWNRLVLFYYSWGSHCPRKLSGWKKFYLLFYSQPFIRRPFWWNSWASNVGYIWETHAFAAIWMPEPWVLSSSECGTSSHYINNMKTIKVQRAENENGNGHMCIGWWVPVWIWILFWKQERLGNS